MAAKYALFDIVLDEISFVDKGDNPHAHILFSKRREDAGDPLVSDADIEKLIGEEGGADPAPVVPVATANRESEGFGKGILRAIGKALGWTDEQARQAEEELSKRDFKAFVERDQGEAFYSQASRLCSAYMNSIDDAVYAISGEDPEVPIRDRIARNTEQFVSAIQSAASSMEAGSLEKARHKPNLAALRGAAAAIGAAWEDVHPPDDPRSTVPANKREEAPLKLSEAIRAKLQKGEPLTDEEAREIISAAEAPVEKNGPETETPTAGGDDDAAFEAMVKSADPALRDYLSKQRAEQQADRAEIAKMREEREITDVTKRLTNLGFASAGEMAKEEGFRKLYRDNPDAMSKVDAHIQALTERANLNSRLGQQIHFVGKGGAEGSAYAEATRLAEEKVGKGEARTIEAARAQVYRENRALQKRVSDEQASAQGEVAS